jgi:hypothetical protein
MLTALRGAEASRYTVIGLECEAALGQNASRFHTTFSAVSPNSNATGTDSEVPALVVFSETDRYSDKQLEEIFQHLYERARIGNQSITAAVFLARAEFLSRLEHPVLRAWLAKRLLMARVRFDELGTDEIAAFIHHQLPSEGAEKIFTDEAIAAIANVSGGDPVVVNRFSRRMLDCAAASVGNAFEKASFGSAAVMSRDMPPEEQGVTTFTERLRQNYKPESDLHLSARIPSDRVPRLKVCAGIAFCFACAGMIATVAFISPVADDITAFRTAPSTDISPKLAAQPSATGRSPNSDMASTTEGSTADLQTAALTAVAPPAAPGPEHPLASETALPQSAPTHRPTAELTTMKAASETLANAAAPPQAPTEVAKAAPPREMQASRSTADSRPDQLHLPAAEIAALLARGDRLFALGDVSSARLFYERAADAGEGRAALRLGKTFDPVILDFVHLRVRGDAAMAVLWYGRALELGEAEAEVPLKRLEPAR